MLTGFFNIPIKLSNSTQKLISTLVIMHCDNFHFQIHKPNDTQCSKGTPHYRISTPDLGRNSVDTIEIYLWPLIIKSRLEFRHRFGVRIFAKTNPLRENRCGRFCANADSSCWLVVFAGIDLYLC